MINNKNKLEQNQLKAEENYQRLLDGNRDWAKKMREADPQYFEKMSAGQSPEYMFITCSDSRVLVNTMTNTGPGEIFVHRNVANIVSLTDINLLSALEFAVKHLKVKNIVVCGHYQCGGVHAAINGGVTDSLQTWTSQIKSVIELHEEELSRPVFQSPQEYEKRVIELHVKHQVRNLAKSNIIQDALAKTGFPKLHGWVFDFATGLIKELKTNLELFDRLNNFKNKAS
jgi:carbonic anhydrase